MATPRPTVAQGAERAMLSLHHSNRRAGCEAHKSGSVRGAPGNRGLYSAGSTSEARSGWALPNTTHFTWVSVASSIEGNQIEKMEGPQNGKSSSVATPWGAVAASTAAR